MFDFRDVESCLNTICDGCADKGTDQCVKEKCYVGFAQNMIEFSKKGSAPSIPNGHQMVPLDDMKLYREDQITDAIAQVCKVCHECKNRHTEDCLVSMVRRSLENAVFQDNTVYKGSVLMYLMDLSRQEPRLAAMIKEAYMEP